ncbi:MAG TPA: cation:proton antiporter [Aquifex aeolicus]|uniref:Cation:proton antiporter n=1 Tax=Aquifex aeolicus TaxID=63363 RepID=A0A9D0YS70_AQUAO|nr:cation:proton antiporter [Aquificales bacterium]HIP98762.1 cation:proton antiporter [Aquifex aeolicus]HIQ25927.1 cation:proton antiporter [Aquifex aeolicus]
MEKQIFSLILITLGVFVIPFLSPFLRIPVAVGELLYGMVLVPLMDKADLEVINFLSFLGFSLLMFLAGLEIDWNKLETLKAREKLVIALVVASNFLLAGLAVKVLKLSVEAVLILGALGIGLMLSVLRELKISPYFKQIVLITGSLGEVITLLGLTVYDLHLTFGWSSSFYLYLALIGLFGLFFVFLLKVINLLVWYYPTQVASLIAEETKAAVDIRASFALMLLFMAFTSFIHVEPILGAFIAGTLLGFIFREKKQFEAKLSSFGYGFLIPFFFVQVGFSFDFSSLSVLFLQLSVVILVAIFVIKVLSSAWFKLLGFSTKEILLAGLLFSFPFTVLIAIGKILHEKGVWDSSNFALIVLITVISSILFPVAVKFLSSKESSA